MRDRLRHFSRHPLRSTVRLFSHLLVRLRGGGSVISGPFAGAWFDLPFPHLPAVLGSYERELHPTIEALALDAPAVIADVGAADGYYVAGLGRRIARARIVAFEQREDKRRRLTRVVAENGLGERVTVAGLCTPAALERAIAGSRALVWMDVDGGEELLLDPRSVPALRAARIVVEVHEFAVKDCEAMLRGRFEATHAIERIPEVARTTEDFPLRSGLWATRLGRRLATAAMDERRPEPQSWLAMTPREQ